MRGWGKGRIVCLGLGCVILSWVSFVSFVGDGYCVRLVSVDFGFVFVD